MFEYLYGWHRRRVVMNMYEVSCMENMLKTKNISWRIPKYIHNNTTKNTNNPCKFL